MRRLLVSLGSWLLFRYAQPDELYVAISAALAKYGAQLVRIAQPRTLSETDPLVVKAKEIGGGYDN